MGKQRGGAARSALPQHLPRPNPPRLLPATPGSCHLLHDTLPFLPSPGTADGRLDSGTRAMCQLWYPTPLLLLRGCH